MNRCMSQLDDYKFHSCDSVYENWVAVCLERYFPTSFPIIRWDFLSDVHALQVSILFFSQILIVVILVLQVRNCSSGCIRSLISHDSTSSLVKLVI